MMKTASIHLAVLTLAIASIGVFSPAAAEEFDVPLSIDADQLVLVDLIGEITVQGHSGSQFEIDIRVRGDDADRDLIDVDVDKGKRTEVYVRFPLKRESRFVYPRLGRGSHSELQISDGWRGRESWLERMIGILGGRRVHVKGSGRGVEAWADVTIKVPRDKQLTVELGVGEIRAEDVQADLNLDTHHGPISVSGAEGELYADTGSGAVEVEDVEGNVLVDTGSGQVTLRRCRGKEVNVDTGSGSVRLINIDCRDLNVDTGSGGVVAQAIGADDVMIDTGSGSVVLELDRMGDGTFVLDTGSGSIDLLLPPRASARVMAETGSGRIRLDLEDSVKLRRRGRDEVAFRIGDGNADVRLDTGSGSITVSQ